MEGLREWEWEGASFIRVELHRFRLADDHVVAEYNKLPPCLTHALPETSL